MLCGSWIGKAEMRKFHAGTADTGKEDVQAGAYRWGTKTDPSMPRAEGAGGQPCPPFPLGVFCGWPVLDASGWLGHGQLCGRGCRLQHSAVHCANLPCRRCARSLPAAASISSPVPHFDPPDEQPQPFRRRLSTGNAPALKATPTECRVDTLSGFAGNVPALRHIRPRTVVMNYRIFLPLLLF